MGRLPRPCPRRSTATAALSRAPGAATAALDPPWPLSDDASAHVFAFLDARALAATALVCRQWRSVSRADALWWQLCAAVPGVGSLDLERARPCEPSAVASSPSFSPVGAWRAHNLFCALALANQLRSFER